MQLWSYATKSRLTENLKSHRNIYMFNGVVFIALGIFALFAPLMAAKFLFMLIGCLFLITGIFQLVVNFVTKHHFAYYITSLLAIAAGVILLVQPTAGIYFFGLIIALFLLLQGIMQLFYAGLYAPFRGWGWMLGSGILSIALALFVFLGWPLSAGWLFGFLIAINFILFGFSMLTIARHFDQNI